MRSLIPILLTLILALPASADLALGDTVGVSGAMSDIFGFTSFVSETTAVVSTGFEYFTLFPIIGTGSTSFFDTTIDWVPVDETTFTITYSWSTASGTFFIGTSSSGTPSSITFTDPFDSIDDFDSAVVVATHGGLADPGLVTIIDVDTIVIDLTEATGVGSGESFTVTVTTVPEPGTLPLAVALLGALYWRRRSA